MVEYLVATKKHSEMGAFLRFLQVLFRV